jgi:hypothetical protein
MRQVLIINGTFIWYILLTSDTVAIYTEWGHLFPKKNLIDFFFFFSVVRSGELVDYRLQRNEEFLFIYFFGVVASPNFGSSFPVTKQLPNFRKPSSLRSCDSWRRWSPWRTADPGAHVKIEVAEERVHCVEIRLNFYFLCWSRDKQGERKEGRKEGISEETAKNQSINSQRKATLKPSFCSSSSKQASKQEESPIVA